MPFLVQLVLAHFWVNGANFIKHPDFLNYQLVIRLLELFEDDIHVGHSVSDAEVALPQLLRLILDVLPVQYGFIHCTK